MRKPTLSKNKVWDYILPVLLPISFFLIEVFALEFLDTGKALTRSASAWSLFRQNGYVLQNLGKVNLWPLAFGAAWAVILTCIIWILPGKSSVAAYGFLYFLSLAYTIVQTGYFLLFQEMMWISDFRYASEGSDYFSVLLDYPIEWYICIALLIALGILLICKYPKRNPPHWIAIILLCVITVSGCVGIRILPKIIFRQDKEVQLAETDYKRSMSAEAAYKDMFNTHRLYQICGIYQTAAKDIYEHYIYPLTPAYQSGRAAAKVEIEEFFDSQPISQENAMTGLLKDKNVVLVLMESMDDWMIGEHTPTLQKMMQEGLNFTNFYTPVYGGIRTFNTEYCINTGSFLSSSGGYAFDYINNTLNNSLANLLSERGYSSLLYHYNTPDFYSRGIFSEAMGYEKYISYVDYVDWSGDAEQELFDDQLLFNSTGLSDSFFREGKKLNFIITRSAHLSYKYNEVLSHWGLKKYPEYRDLTDNEETNCALLKARLVDDFFARMLAELEAHGELDNTIIVAVTDHYTYGYKDIPSLLSLSGVSDTLLLEKTPCFIWGADVPALQMDKLLNTSDLLPTLLNLMDVDSPYHYIGHDAFDEDYDGFVPFSDGSWISGDVAYAAGKKALISISGETTSITKKFQEQMDKRVQDFVRINNLILDIDYYKSA